MDESPESAKDAVASITGKGLENEYPLSCECYTFCAVAGSSGKIMGVNPDRENLLHRLGALFKIE